MRFEDGCYFFKLLKQMSRVISETKLNSRRKSMQISFAGTPQEVFNQS